jgi:AraC-like DNA-binding protein
MPSSTVRAFTDPDDYTASLRGGRTQLTVTGRGLFNAKLIQINLHNVWVQHISENLPRISHGAHVPGRTSVSFWPRFGPNPRWRGVEMNPNSLVMLNQSADYYLRSAGALAMGSMSLPAEQMALMAAAFVGCDLIPPSDGLMLTPAPPALARLRRLHAAARRLAIGAPETIEDPQAAHGLEQNLIEAMLGCLGTVPLRDGKSASLHRQMIMRRFHTLLEEHSGRALHLPELCALLGVTERTLRRCCQEQLGIGPGLFLVLRRLHLARRALRHADATGTTVATRFGFWDFGRFAGVYASMFGEPPSLTLRHPA